ncbi:MAG: mannitol dehydrogenase family protein [Actinomycetaceae bacterium]|nr:mannitol dehydrogenase family protein [Actinomycetaceae bacterium]
MTNLNRETFPRDLQIGASAPQHTGIVHIGIAQFHRAHAAIATAQALAVEPGDWGIVGVASHSPRVVDALAAQDGLYSILQLTPEGESVGVVDVHRDFAVAAQDPAKVVDLIARPEHKIVTLTVSENGYRRDSRTGGLDRSDPAVQADLAGGEPSTTIGLVSRGLLRRFADGGGPVTILSCDNMVSAGSQTKALVLEFLREVDAGPEVFEWLERSVTFPNAMVDRIVPATTDDTRQAVRRIAGYDDAVPVPAEGFTMWVLEDNFAAGRPAWEHAEGVIFSDEVEKYELVKLRLLNGSHSLIAYLGGLDVRETIPASRSQDFVERCVRNALYDEYLPSIDLPSGFDADAYIGQLFERWTNFALGDKTARVGSDGSAKLVHRIPAPAIRLLEQGIVPQQMALTAAAWICCVCPPAGFDPGPVAAEMIEPKRQALADATEGAADAREHVEAIMRAGIFPDELVAHEAFGARVAELVEIIVTDGVQAAADDACRRRLEPIG